VKTPFLGGAYEARSSNLNDQRCVNLYAEMTAPGGREIGAFFGTPGMSEWQLLSGQCRGMHVLGGFLYVVMDTTLYKINEDSVVTELGTVNNTGYVVFADNVAEIIMATGGTGYLLTTATDVLTTIASNYPVGAKTVTYIDGYFVVEEPGTRQFWQSDLLDGATWNALNFASKEGSSDNLVRVIANHRDLWLMGEQTCEVWYGNGQTPFSFAKNTNAFIEQGLAAVYSVANVDGSLVWLGNRGGVFVANAYTPVRISTPAIEREISNYERVDDAIAWSYYQEGHHFYVLTFPTVEKTWCFDASTKLWHERTSMLDDGSMTRNRANAGANFMEKVIVGDFENGRLSRLDLDTYDENGGPLKRLRSWGHINQSGERMFFSQGQLIAETGVGKDGVQQGDDPQVMLRWSDDGGHTWSNEHWSSLGRIGRGDYRAIWRRLGESRDRIFELSMTDPVKVAWMGFELK
jgi:hypothetical protein